MALPQLNDSPKYELVIPSTKQKVRFRPFLVKEEKVMLMALESENQNDILNTIVDTIKTCVADDIDVNKFTTFDVEYCFLQIRAKSAGERANIKLQCEECKTDNEVVVKVDDIVIDVPTVENIIDVNDDIKLEMRWPSYNKVLQEDILASESSVDQIFGLIRSCIVSINTNEERFSAEDHSKEELDKFIESMNTEQFGRVQKYVESMPRLSHDVEFNCISCAKENKLTIEGMQNFF